MFTVNLAKLKIRIDNTYDFVEDMCKEYVTDNLNYDFFVSVSDDEISAEQTGGYKNGYLESLAIYRKIADKILDYNGLLIHGVLMKAKNRGILICAESGVGKSTHAMLWKQLLGEDCEIINGDKPLLRFSGRNVYGYGTPWAGKERQHKNEEIILTDICFLKRANENQVKRMTKNIAVPLLNQIYLPKKDGFKTAKTLELADEMIKNTRQWEIKCNMDISAARTVYEAIWK